MPVAVEHDDAGRCREKRANETQRLDFPSPGRVEVNRTRRTGPFGLPIMQRDVEAPQRVENGESGSFSTACRTRRPLPMRGTMASIGSCVSSSTSSAVRNDWSIRSPSRARKAPMASPPIRRDQHELARRVSRRKRRTASDTTRLSARNEVLLRLGFLVTQKDGLQYRSGWPSASRSSSCSLTDFCSLLWPIWPLSWARLCAAFRSAHRPICLVPQSRTMPLHFDANLALDIRFSASTF